ncbi:major facilitator superfamily transporter [Grosmannia clavigera kw1407]|uniref:Major facilitator superfamily transporter n=1 Tax=Grosmannia clavigera (strain kw1407 / UAMH 11150) TaxID=655863 RepID=F0XCL7_GROCL|nr:major facilitator superfamily transporter [Grosmannia clavigera kw1407]EFX04103.1 major facilitator superfamily transporter [Grosmannia clavigera kw1407]
MVTRHIRYAYRESGLASVYATGRDAWIIILARSLRMFAYGASSLILALFFAALDVSDERIGLFMSLTLAGDVVLSLVLTFLADHFGRRRTILLGSVLMAVSGLAFAFCENYWLLLMAAIVGVISANGGDFGPFRVVEESMLSELTDPNTRADVLVWYVTVSALGSSVGTAVAGHVIHRLHSGPAAWPLLRVYHLCYLAYAVTGALNLGLSLVLSPPAVSTSSDSFSVDSAKAPRDIHDYTLGHTPDHTYDDSDNDDDDDEQLATPSPSKSRFSQISSQTRRTLYALWFLLMVDSLADGMATMPLTTYYLDTKFPKLGKNALGSILSASYFLAACSSIFAGPLARYIGLVNTMVFTHVPSSAAVLLFPWPASVWLTCVLLLVRVGLNNLDQAPRAALIAAIVRSEERTAVMGVTSLLRTLASTTGPSLTGLLAGHDRFWIAFVVSGALRLAYDFGLFAMFVNIRLYQYEAVPNATAAAEADSELSRSTRDVLDEEESIG